MSELVVPKFIDNATEIAKVYPSFVDQFRYKKLLEVAKQLGQKTPERNRADIEVQVALAASINAAVKSGEVTARNKNYQVGSFEVHGGEVDRWRKLRKIPTRERDAYYAEAKNPSRHALLNWWSDKQVDGRAVEDIDDTVDLVSDFAELEGRKFGTIYADPPWSYSNQGTRAATDNHYSTMSVDQLCEMPVRELVADDAHLHLWTTNAFMPESFRLIDAWGFEYKSCAVWCKPEMGIGNYVRVSHEFILIAVKGDAKRFKKKNVMSWFSQSRGKHSAKPDYWRKVIEENSPGPWLEMFGREQVAGWTIFGNQISKQQRIV